MTGDSDMVTPTPAEYDSSTFIELRYPPIKNDYFDRDKRIYYFWNDPETTPTPGPGPDFHETDPQVRPVSTADAGW